MDNPEISNALNDGLKKLIDEARSILKQYNSAQESVKCHRHSKLATLASLVKDLLELNNPDGLVCLQNLLNFECLKQFLTIDSSVIVSVLNFIEQNNFPQDFPKILEKLTEHKWFDKINFSNEHSFEHVELNLQAKILALENARKCLENARNNLNQKSLQEILEHFQEEPLPENFNDQFKDNIQFLSIILNNNAKEDERSFLYWNLFKPLPLFHTFTKYLSHLIQNIPVIKNPEEHVDAVENEMPKMRYILEIIYKIMSYSYDYCESFLEASLLIEIINLFNKLDLLKYLYNNHVPILAKVIGIFFNLCKHAHYTRREFETSRIGEETRSFSTLRKSRDTIKELSQEELDKDTYEFKIYYIYVFKLCSLKYLEIKFKPNEPLLDFKHYEDIVKGNFVKHTFSKVNNNFTQKNDPVLRELINENDEREKCLVYKLFLRYSRNTTAMTRTVPDVLDNIRCVYSTEKTKVLAFPMFWPFFKSVILYGLVIERIVCLNCLKSFCQVNQIREKVLGDKEVVEFLKVVKTNNNNNSDDIIQRQKVMIETFFAQY